MRILKIFIVLLLLSASNQAAQRAISDASVTGRWLNLPTGARAVGMGGAVIAASQGAEALRMNPASAAALSEHQAAFSHQLWVADTFSDYLAWAGPITGGVGGGLLLDYLGLGEVQRLVLDSQGQPQVDGNFYPYAMAGGVVLAKGLRQGIDVGLLMRGLYQGLDQYSAGGFAADLGGRWIHPAKSLSLGLVFRNLGPEFSGRSLNTRTEFGSAYTYRLKAPGRAVTLAFDLSLPFEETQEMKVSTGMEYSLNSSFALRLGWQGGLESAPQGLSGGMGIELDWGRVD